MSAIRWLHIYLSMFGFTALLFFAVTGITLNHADWFGLEAESVQDVTGTLPLTMLTAVSPNGLPPQIPSPDGQEAEASDTDASTMLSATSDDGVNRLAVVEALRSSHRLTGKVAEFRVDELECFVSFKGPGFAADTFISRESGHYQLTIGRQGVVAVLNDLHKGRDSGAAWSLLIDVSALLMTLSAVTGVLLLLYLRRVRFSGLVTAIAGTIVVVAVFAWLVP